MEKKINKCSIGIVVS